MHRPQLLSKRSRGLFLFLFPLPIRRGRDAQRVAKDLAQPRRRGEARRQRRLRQRKLRAAEQPLGVGQAQIAQHLLRRAPRLISLPLAPKDSPDKDTIFDDM